MRVYETPGVHYERADASGGGIAALRTDIAGFVGLARRGPPGIAVPVESARQFEAWFGAPIDNGYLAYSARAFFENGGRRMWAVRVTSDAASTAAVTLQDAAGPAWRIEASSPGVWGNALALRVTEQRRAQTRAVVDAVDLTRLHVADSAGFAVAALVECRAGALTETARIAAVEAASSTLVLGAPLALLPANAALRVETITYALEVFDGGRLVALHEGLALIPEAGRYGPLVLRQPWQAPDTRRPDEDTARAAEADLALDYFRVARNRGAVAPPVVVIRELRSQPRRDALRPLVGVGGAAPAAPVPLSGGADGLAALTADDFIGSIAPAGTATDIAAAMRRGIACLEAIDEIALVAVPDIHIQPREPHGTLPPPECAPDRCLPAPPPVPSPLPPPLGDLPPRFPLADIYRVQAAMVAHCERKRDRVALLDAPFDACAKLSYSVNELRAWRSRFETKFAALYAPWVAVVDPLRSRGARALTRPIPPSGHVAGQCAAIDLRSGVHVAPANVALQWVQDTTLAFDEERHGLLNTLGINVVRALPGRGVRVLGARSLSSDSDWRFINVRRLMSMIEKAIDVSIQWAVFEPNDWRTRAKLQLVIGSFLRELWARGALAGNSTDEAYFVRCDDGNNPAAARDRGQLLIEVGVAATVPFEFIVLRIGRDASGFAVSGEGLAATEGA
ncbi:MAG: phage tail sheath subtilisin-like domain-containing protein [Aromatoleum sp.]|uniref:phage tail sheath C-terminal domain-containing protein n=1 Tax=Aromatoleum sp. TaxID=2307007 RepID=UPI0028958EB0|nr:phage tail sheath C-terminal domain-containing protein [Aromatoleum sp.]MDT3671277.1 phage tail sheath subtilisin-like domain-containing protein [Aromatoleum sp.]